MGFNFMEVLDDFLSSHNLGKLFHFINLNKSIFNFHLNCSGNDADRYQPEERLERS